MRDYQFGEWLATLRVSNGYSQFQLGKLLGVSDKAVSKWETGAARPRTSICGKLASIYGITLDELMACQQEAGSSRMYGEQSRVEEPLWQNVRLRLKKVYGDRPPVAVTSRLDAEEILMRGTGMIEHLRLKTALWQKGVRCESWFNMESSLTAWLLGAAIVNPLPPHTVCPACKRTVLHPEVRDGWDLPEGRCACGETLIRDGHDIPLSLTEKRFQEMDRSVIISITQRDETTLRNLISSLYQNRWKMAPYRHAQGEGTISSVFQIAGEYYVLTPAGMKLPYPLVDGKYQLPSDDRVFHVADVPETLVYIGIDPDEPERTTALPVPSVSELVCPETYQKAWQDIRTVDGITLGMLGDCAVSMDVPPDFVDKNGSFGEIRRFNAEDISEWLPDPITFSTVMQVSSTNFERLWHLFAREQVMSGAASVMDYPISEEDIFDHVKRRMLQAGILDSGIALRTMDSLRNQGPSGEVAQALLDIGCEPWLPNYIEFAGKFLYRESKAQMIMSAWCLLYRAALKNRQDFGNTDGESAMPLNSIISSVMMRRAAAAQDLDNET